MLGFRNIALFQRAISFFVPNALLEGSFSRVRGVPRKLLFLVSEDWYFCSHRLPLAVAAKKAGYEVVVVTRLSGMREMIEKAGLRVINLDMHRKSTNPFQALLTLIQLWLIYWRERPDIVHHVALKPVLLGGMVARLTGIRAVVSAVAGMGFLFSDGGRMPIVQGIVKSLISFAIGKGRAIVQNPEDAEILRNLAVPGSRISLIRGAGVNLEQFSFMEEKAGRPIVILPARMLWDKGVLQFVKVARDLRRKGSKARFVLVGWTDDFNPASVLKSQLEHWQQEGIVEWWGKRDDMANVFARSHVVCLPTFYGEGLPKALLEAAACGRPIITTDAPGCREIVHHGENGLLVPIKDAPALEASLLRVLSDPALRARMGKKGREIAEQDFSVEKVVAETLMLYREMAQA